MKMTSGVKGYVDYVDGEERERSRAKHELEQLNWTDMTVTWEKHYTEVQTESQGAMTELIQRKKEWLWVKVVVQREEEPCMPASQSSRFLILLVLPDVVITISQIGPHLSSSTLWSAVNARPHRGANMPVR